MMVPTIVRVSTWPFLVKFLTYLREKTTTPRVADTVSFQVSAKTIYEVDESIFFQ